MTEGRLPLPRITPTISYIAYGHCNQVVILAGFDSFIEPANLGLLIEMQNSKALHLQLGSHGVLNADTPSPGFYSLMQTHLWCVVDPNEQTITHWLNLQHNNVLLSAQDMHMIGHIKKSFKKFRGNFVKLQVPKCCLILFLSNCQGHQSGTK